MIVIDENGDPWDLSDPRDREAVPDWEYVVHIPLSCGLCGEELATHPKLPETCRDE